MISVGSVGVFVVSLLDVGIDQVDFKESSRDGDEEVNYYSLRWEEKDVK